MVGLVVVLLAAAGGIGWLVFGGDDDGGGDDEAGEVFLEPVNVTVADPFGGNFDVHNVRATATTAPRIATTAPPSTATATTTATATATRSVAGAWPGLYGGTRNASTCDRDQLVAFLEANPDKARAWAGVLGVRTADIETYVDGLTPVLLQRDTRVTNHGIVYPLVAAVPGLSLNNIMAGMNDLLEGDTEQKPRERGSLGAAARD